MAALRKLTTAQEKPRGLYHDLGLRLVKLLNVLLIVLPFVCCWLLYYAQRVVVFPSPWRSVCVVGLFTLLYAGFGRVYDAFLVSIKRISELFWSQLLGILMADAFMFIVLWLMSGGFPNLFPASLVIVGQLLLSLFWCKCANSWYFRRFSGQKTAVIYDHERGIADLFS